MNISAKTKNVDWKRIAGIVVVLLFVGYNFAQPTLEKWLKTDLPSLTGENDNASRSPAGDQQDDRYRAKLPKGDTHTKSNATSKPASGDYLKSVGRNKLESPAGLVYTMGPRGEHRVDHVLRHGRDMPDRPVHSVFEGDRNEILATIDEAYELVKSKSRQARTSNSRGNDEHTIQMNRKVGYEGGQKGKRKGYPSLSSIKLILDGNRVITAYPYR